MAKYKNFEELPVWQEAARLYNAVLDFLDLPNVPLSGCFRNQLERAALSISNNVAEGYERFSDRELMSFLSIAKGSAGEVRSMIAVVRNRPTLRKWERSLFEIRRLAESCARQLSAWSKSDSKLQFEGKRQLNGFMRAQQEAQQKAKEYRLRFLRGLKPAHPLYNSPEAKLARGDTDENP